MKRTVPKTLKGQGTSKKKVDRSQEWVGRGGGRPECAASALTPATRLLPIFQKEKTDWKVDCLSLDSRIQTLVTSPMLFAASLSGSASGAFCSVSVALMNFKLTF